VEVLVLTIEEDKFVQRYPELHHYTGWDALEGIFTLNAMWATHYQHLNDQTDIPVQLVQVH
jgi:hypothetical protein